MKKSGEVYFDGTTINGLRRKINNLRTRRMEYRDLSRSLSDGGDEEGSREISRLAAKATLSIVRRIHGKWEK